MKRLLVIFSLVGLLSSCYEETGHLVGVQPRPMWYPETPYGTVYIPPGSFNMGASDQDVPFAHTTRSKTVSVQAFYIDDTEITNNEYRQFVHYVRDSIARVMLSEDDEGYMITEDIFGNELDPPRLDWYYDVIHWYDEEYPEQYELLSEMYLPENDRFFNRREIDTRKLMYDYYWVDLKSAARKAGRDKKLGKENIIGQDNYVWGHSDRSQFVIKETIAIYPDTLCWVHDFTYAFNEPLSKAYFWHVAYDNYPVVGVTWKQAKAFSVWRTQLLNGWLTSRGLSVVQDFRLPTEAEWEYAARGGLDLSPYPWGGPYIRNSRGCFLGNFKPMRGRYMDDGGFHTVEVDSYHPNDYGLYCMAGNVSEWTITAYDESVYEFSHDQNPAYQYEAYATDPPSLKRKVIRGGSWKDIGYYLQTGTRTFEYQDTAKCYIGFRNVMSYLGRAESGDF